MRNVEETAMSAGNVPGSGCSFRLADPREPELARPHRSRDLLRKTARPPLREELLRMILRNENARKCR